METIKKVINGVEYVAEWKGLAFSNARLEACKVKGSNRMNKTKLANVFFNELLISPKIGIDDINDMKQLHEILKFAQSILEGTYDDTSKAELSIEVDNEWAAYRLVFCEFANYTEDYVFNVMTPKQIKKANIALDKISEEIKKQTNK